MTDPAVTAVTARPELVYVPSLRVADGDSEVQLVLRRIDDVAVLLVYSSLEELVAGCGPHQPWVAVPSDVLDTLLPGIGADAVLLDVALAQEDWVTAS
jgi:hypothetical protein